MLFRFLLLFLTLPFWCLVYTAWIELYRQIANNLAPCSPSMPSLVASVLLLVNSSLQQVCACKLATAELVLDRSRAPRERMRGLQMRVKNRGRVFRMRGEFLFFSALSFHGDIQRRDGFLNATNTYADLQILEPSPITSSEA